jgi:gluconolactonase
MLQWSSSQGLGTYRAPSEFANGNFACANGDMLTCEHGRRRVIRTTQAGMVSVVCDRFRGARLNSPNDVVEKTDGSVWFSDPSYGILSNVEGCKANSEQDACRVYRVDAMTQLVSAEVVDLKMPNGLTFSPREDVLFVADSGADMGPEVAFNPMGPRDVFAYPLAEGRVSGAASHVWHVVEGVPDGIRCDPEGHLWIATGRGIECIDPAGACCGLLTSDEPVTNLAFGGPDHRQLLITLVTRAVLLDLSSRG